MSGMTWTSSLQLFGKSPSPFLLRDIRFFYVTNQKNHTVVPYELAVVIVIIPFFFQVETSKVVLKEGGVQLTLTIVDTPGFGDAVDNSNWYVGL